MIREPIESLSEQGPAAYHAPKFAGETTASGEPYDPDAFTAAHRRLPFDTHVRVVRIDGGEHLPGDTDQY
jgi:rare lipoprotein A